MIRAFPFTAFIIALLLTAGTVEPEGAWLVTLAVLTGLHGLRPRFSPFGAVAIAAFVIALLLAIDAIEPTGGWLVSLTVLTGIEAFRPGSSRGRRRWRDWAWEWDWNRDR